MKPELKVIGMTPDTGKKAGKDCFGNFEQEIAFKVEGIVPLVKTTVSARRKKDLPNSVKFMQNRVAKGSVTVTLNDAGNLESIIYPMFS